MRRSPIHHPVREHTRNGKHIHEYERGSGVKRQRKSRVVGKKMIIPEVLISEFQAITGYDNEYRAGSCGPFAVALYHHLGSGAELYTYGFSHFFVKYKNQYIDAGGVYSTKKELKVENGYPLQEDDEQWFWRPVTKEEIIKTDTDRKQVKKIQQILRQIQ